jgi:EAL domain-containing protein (putative c-di-GMP-specific phosphodiesterase class I)
MRSAVISAGLLGVGVAVWRALSGDQGARLVLPGLALIVASPFAGSLGAVSGEAVSLLPHALFTLGVLGASIAAFTEETHFKSAARPFLSDGMSMGADAYETAHGSAPEYAAPPKQSHKGQERAEIALDSQLARVLDYSGVAVWDWSPEFIDQTESLPRILGADRAAPFTPDALRNFIHKDDIARFESEILAPAEGPFDAALKLFDGRKIRMRGARAADEESGSLERLVAFIEAASPIFKPSEESGVDGAKVQMATKAAIVPSTAGLVVQNLAQALERGDIVAAFQPIVSLKDEKIVGYEALARWPGQGKTMKEGPATFAKAADIAGKGGVLAQTMLDQAAAFLVEQRKSADRKDIFVALNVTWGQMRGEGFVEAVRETIARCGLEKNALVLELTEGDAVTDDDEAGKIFTALRNAGAALAFDDFGAGFSCLSNLRKYDFDYLKIDKSFAADLERKGDGAKIVGCLTRLGKELGLKVIVEGIETKTAAKAAAALGCAYAQGYALGAPTGGESKSATAAALSPKNGPAATDKNNAQAQKGAGNADNGDVASAPESAPAKTESLVQEPAPANESQRMRWVLRRR